jgi:hypothetical protein
MMPRHGIRRPTSAEGTPDSETTAGTGRPAAAPRLPCGTAPKPQALMAPEGRDSTALEGLGGPALPVHLYN